MSTETEKTTERKFWQLASDDKRVLYVTFIGGLAANVGLVLIVGLGLVEAHLIYRYRHSLETVLLPQIAIIGGSLVANLIAAAIGDLLRRSRRSEQMSDPDQGSEPSPASRPDIIFGDVIVRHLDNYVARNRVMVRRVGLSIAALLGAILVLGFVGAAAGIK